MATFAKDIITVHDNLHMALNHAAKVDYKDENNVQHTK